MKLICIALLSAVAGLGQATLESWGCDSITGATQTNPVSLTCNTAHGWTVGASFPVQIAGATGAWAAGINTQRKRSYYGPRAIQASDTSIPLFEADSQEVGGQMTIESESGITVNSIAWNVVNVTRSSPIFHFPQSVPGYSVTPPSSIAVMIFNSNRPLYRLATATDATHLSVPVDGTALGAFSGSATLRRCNYLGNRYGDAYVGLDNAPGLTTYVSNGVMTLTVPPLDTTSATTLAPAKSNVAGKLSNSGLISSIVVTRETTTITFVAPFALSQASTDPMATNALIYVWGTTDNRLNDSFVVRGTDANSNPTVITVDTPAGVADGTYTAATGQAANFKAWLAFNTLPYFDFTPTDSSGQWSYPGAFLQSWVKSGTFDAGMNRISFFLRETGTNVQRRADGGGLGAMGTYTKGVSFLQTAVQDQAHWYHYHNTNLYSGAWTKWTMDRQPTHQVGSGGNWPWPNDLTYSGWVGDAYTAPGRHYFDALIRIYVQWFTGYTAPSRSYAGSTWQIGPITLETKSGEPSGSVSNIVATWSANRFTQISGCAYPGEGGQPACTGVLGGGPGYELTWENPKQLPAAMSYEVRRSTTSMRTAGFSTGLCNDGSTTCTSGSGDVIASNQTYYAVQWAGSTPSTQPADTFVAIRPKFTVMGVSGNGVSPIQVSLPAGHNMQVGDLVTTASVGGNTAANQTNAAITAVTDYQYFYRFDPGGVRICAATNATPIVLTTCDPHGISNGATVRVDQALVNTAMNAVWTSVTVIDATTISLTGSTGNGAYNHNGGAYAFVHGPGPLSQIVAASNTCTATTVSAHGLAVGMRVSIVGSTSATLGSRTDASQVFWTIATVPTSTTFTSTCTGVADGTYDSDYSTPGIFPPSFALSFEAFPTISIAGTGNANWTSGGTLVSSEDLKNFTEVEITPFGATLVAAPSSVTLSCIAGSSTPTQQSIAISGVGSPVLDNWSASKGQSWLSLSPSSGSAAGSTIATANCLDLTAGSYSDTVSVASATAGVVNSPVAVPVSLTVTAHTSTPGNRISGVATVGGSVVAK